MASSLSLEKKNGAGPGGSDTVLTKIYEWLPELESQSAGNACLHTSSDGLDNSFFQLEAIKSTARFLFHGDTE